jgi:hypothetical protein
VSDVTKERLEELQALVDSVPATDMSYNSLGGLLFGRCVGGCNKTESTYRVADMRGWGHLQYREDGEADQNATGRLFAESKSAISDLIAHVRNLEAELTLFRTETADSSAIVCSYCGEAFPYDGEEPLPEMLERAIAHEGVCEKNPHLKEIKVLESTLELMATEYAGMLDGLRNVAGSTLVTEFKDKARRKLAGEKAETKDALP